MKKKKFIVLFLCLNSLLIFLQLYKRSRFTQYSFQKQKHEAHLVSLRKKKQDLITQLQTIQNREQVFAFAKDHLAMAPISLSQINELKKDE